MSHRLAGRVDAASFALRQHQWAKGDLMVEDDVAVIDLLADLRHYCQAQRLDYEDLDGIANAHYLIERPG
ncbi:MAG: hypothetical protein ACIAS6_01295 [Phycisphaerales bacterium JB060]